MLEACTVFEELVKCRYGWTTVATQLHPYSQKHCQHHNHFDNLPLCLAATTLIASLSHYHYRNHNQDDEDDELLITEMLTLWCKTDVDKKKERNRLLLQQKSVAVAPQQRYF